MRSTPTRGWFAEGLFCTLAIASCASVAGSDEPWRDEFKVGDAVELKINDSFSQRCVVIENNAGSVMRGRCDEFVEPAPGTYRRAGGNYILSRGDTRALSAPSATATATATNAPVSAAARRSSATSPVRPSGAVGTGFAVGTRVEIEASGHWVPCVVAENQPGAIMRVRCDEYPELSRGAGVYTVDRDPASVRLATGNIGKPPAAPPAAARAEGPGALKQGEYACYGSGGRLLIGLGFEVLPGNRYVDLDGGNAGTFSVSGTSVSFSGGHLDGQSGRDLRGASFTLGANAGCEPY